MKVYVMDSFSDRIFGGNQAGVVLADKALEPAVMQQVAAELKHSETADGGGKPTALLHPSGGGRPVWPRHCGGICSAA